MAPFKLKFRMGGSRSTSQEHDPDPQVNEALLNHHQQQQNGTSTSTLDSADCNSLASLGVNSERRSLLPNAANANKTNNFRLGYLSSANKETSNNATDTTNVPSTPPPSYEHVLEELQNTHLSSQYMHSPQRQTSIAGSGDNLHRQSRRSSANSVQSNPLEQIYELETCTDPNCEENIAYNERQRLQREQQENNQSHSRAIDNNENSNNVNEARKNSIDSSEYLLSTNMTSQQTSEEQLLNDCTGDCQRCDMDMEYENGACGGGGGGGGSGGEGHNGNAGGSSNNRNGNNDFCDPLMNHSNSYYDNEQHSNSQHGQDSSFHDDDAYNSQTRQHHQQEQQQQPAVRHVRTLPPEVISNKSSKEIYKDLAKQWGITCKMSDGCRCMECQSHYFDCEFDDNEHQKTDGGLGAGTPMFISEVMHGSACHIL